MSKLRVNTGMRILRPVPEVFEAVANPVKLSGYFTSTASGYPKEGARLLWTWADFGGGAKVEILVKRVLANQILCFEWEASGVRSLVTLQFAESKDNSTQVTVTEAEWDSDEKGIVRAMEQTQGWVHMLTCLKAYLEYGGINLRKGMV